MVLAEFLADVRQAQIGQLPDQIHGDLTGLSDALGLLAAAQGHLVHGVELAHLRNDQAGGGQGVAFGLEHIVNGPGNVLQIQGHVVQIPVGQDLLDGAFDLTDIVGDIDGDVVAYIIVQIQTQMLGLVFQNGHTGLVVRGLDVRQQTPLETGLQTVFQGQHIAGTTVGGHDDLLMLLVELVEGMEKFFLGGFLAGDELDIVDEEQIGLPILAAELDILTALNGSDQLVGELVALDVDDLGVRLLLADAIGDGVEQMGLAHAGRAVDEQGVVHIAGMIADGDGSGVGEPVGGAHHEIIEIELGVEVHGSGLLALIFEGGQLIVTEYHQLGIGVEDLLQRLLDIAGVALDDHFPAIIRGGVEDQMLLVELDHFRIIEPGGHHDAAQLFFHITIDFRPHIGRRKHKIRGSFPGKNPSKNRFFPTLLYSKFYHKKM